MWGAIDAINARIRKFFQIPQQLGLCAFLMLDTSTNWIFTRRTASSQVSRIACMTCDADLREISIVDVPIAESPVTMSFEGLRTHAPVQFYEIEVALSHFDWSTASSRGNAAYKATTPLRKPG